MWKLQELRPPPSQYAKLRGDSHVFEDDPRTCRSFTKVGKMIVLGICLLLASCGNATRAVSTKAAELVLATVGVKSTEKKDVLRTVTMRVDAAKDLNAGEDRQGLPTVARLYKLRSATAFMATPYVHFNSPEKEKLAFGGDVIEVKELTLLPGKTTEINEKMPGEAAYLGVVALFRTPAANRWRLTFSTPSTEGQIIKVGAHACALTATTLAPEGMTLNESSLLSASRCR